ncbi:MAG TPA: hypothetical protein VIS48_13095 [Candidatus Kryptonia bacterium]
MVFKVEEQTKGILRIGLDANELSGLIITTGLLSFFATFLLIFLSAIPFVLIEFLLNLVGLDTKFINERNWFTVSLQFVILFVISEMIVSKNLKELSGAALVIGGAVAALALDIVSGATRFGYGLFHNSQSGSELTYSDGILLASAFFIMCLDILYLSALNGDMVSFYHLRERRLLSDWEWFPDKKAPAKRHPNKRMAKP